MAELSELAKLLQGGGNVALLVCVYFIYKAAERLGRIGERLARIEAKLGLLTKDSDDDTSRG